MFVFISESKGNSNLKDLLKNSLLTKKHTFVFSNEFSDSRSFLVSKAEVVLAEVSEATTDVAIDLGRADILGLPIVCFYQKGTTGVDFFKTIHALLFEYESNDKLLQITTTVLSELESSHGITRDQTVAESTKKVSMYRQVIEDEKKRTGIDFHKLLAGDKREQQKLEMKRRTATMRERENEPK